MPAPAKKVVAPKKKPVAPAEPFDVDLTYVRSTKNTHVFEEPEGAKAIGGRIYLSKELAGEEAPTGATITVQIHR